MTTTTFHDVHTLQIVRVVCGIERPGTYLVNNELVSVAGPTSFIVKEIPVGEELSSSWTEPYLAYEEQP